MTMDRVNREMTFEEEAVFYEKEARAEFAKKLVTVIALLLMAFFGEVCGLFVRQDRRLHAVKWCGVVIASLVHLLGTLRITGQDAQT